MPFLCKNDLGVVMDISIKTSARRSIVVKKTNHLKYWEAY